MTERRPGTAARAAGRRRWRRRRSWPAASPACRPASRPVGLDAALLAQNADLYYFSGTVQQSYLYVPVAGEATLFVRKLAERARLESPLGAVVELPTPEDLPRLIAERYGALPRAARPRARRAAGGALPPPREAPPGGGLRGRRPRHRAPARRQVAVGGRAHPRRGGRDRRGQPAHPRHPRGGPHRGRVRRPGRGRGAPPRPRGLHPHARLQPGDVLRPAADRRERLRVQLPRHAAGRHRPQPVGRSGRELQAHRPRRAGRVRLRARARRLHRRLHAHVRARPAGRGARCGPTTPPCACRRRRWSRRGPA